MPTLLLTDHVPAAEIAQMRDAVATLPQGSALAIILEGILDAAHKGEDVSVYATTKDLSTNDVAHLLKVSRPFVVKLMDDGVLASHLVGTHRRCTMADLHDYLERRERARADFARATGSAALQEKVYLDRRAPIDDEVSDELRALGFRVR